MLFRWILDMQPDAGELWAFHLGAWRRDRRGESFFQNGTPRCCGMGELSLVEKLVEGFRRSSGCGPASRHDMGEFHSGAGVGHRAMLFVKIGKRIGAGWSATVRCSGAHKARSA